jgi:cysteine desulfuration protein SufE
MSDVSQRLEAVVEEFRDLDGREKLELLVDYASGLPPLPREYEARKAAAEGRIHECQTPVFLWTERGDDGTVRLVADVAPEAPTVKGYVAILAAALLDRPAAEVADIPEDFSDLIGLGEVLGMLRSRGLRAITSRIKRSFGTQA